MTYKHTPVMLREVLNFLNPKKGEYFIDCTMGGGGYTIAISNLVGNQGIVVSIDLDEIAINNLKRITTSNRIKNIKIVNDNFKNLQTIISNIWQDRKVPGFNGIVFDLGLSSAQLSDGGRGFSFQLDAPLDMAFGRTVNERSTRQIINFWTQEQLEKILREYGEEKYAAKIAKAIVAQRIKKEIRTTKDLVKIIQSVVPRQYVYNKRIHYATRTFQALRIATNNELANIKESLPQAINLLKQGGKVAVISYHSLEDRIVKHFFRQESKKCVCPKEAIICNCEHIPNLKIITKKPITPHTDEIKKNSRARSAKLRVAEKI